MLPSIRTWSRWLIACYPSTSRPHPMETKPFTEICHLRLPFQPTGAWRWSSGYSCSCWGTACWCDKCPCDLRSFLVFFFYLRSLRAGHLTVSPELTLLTLSSPGCPGQRSSVHTEGISHGSNMPVCTVSKWNFISLSDTNHGSHTDGTWERPHEDTEQPGRRCTA